MFGINGAEFIVLLVVAVVVIGPERLPRYAEQLGSFVRSARGYLRDAKARVDAEIGDEIADVDWSKLDPRQYDPRRIVREALLDDEPVRERVAPPPPPAPSPVPPGSPAPFDDEAT
ncbi:MULTISPECIES: twin-arginine translocase TatA/TatE family subunit [Cellulosimicrobium]|uniref:twin-arginine translocase TatA/TatE family subunit n=1 Tax=Cellulosimicrobium TaxID=157920 RepID=UPI002097754B|nr:twin-arginine translocase TatA/TatE family subunit [Cellulosimicrobium cellulans]MCO7272837.1 twin-arginine translocase TatA/TatE family subunit [Cellulosimicrobium cellulans]